MADPGLEGEARPAREGILERRVELLVLGELLLVDGQLRGPKGKLLPEQTQLNLAAAVTGLFCDGLASIVGPLRDQT